MNETVTGMEDQLDREIQRRHVRAVLRSAARVIRQNPTEAGELFDMLRPKVSVEAICSVLASMDGNLRARLAARLDDPDADEMLHTLSLAAASALDPDLFEDAADEPADATA